MAVRWPLLNRPLSGHHELCTALVLIILHNWQHDGYTSLHAAPAISFSGPADLIPPGYTDAPGLHEGVLYYLSHPPLAYDLPYAVFTITESPPNALGLQLFNLLFHLFTAAGLYLILRELDSQGHSPLFASLLYLFMPAPLWFHGNVYMSDMFVQNAWVWHVLFALRALKSDRGISWHMAILCALTLFLTTLVSWPGVWAGITLGALSLWQWRTRKDATRLRLIAAAIAGVGAALAFTAWRWLQVVDAHALWAYFTGRYADRGSLSIDGPAGMLGTLLLNYRISWLPLMIPLGVLLWRRRSFRSWSRQLSLFIGLTALPIVLEMALLLEYTKHDFAALKAGLLLCGLGGLGLSALHVRWSWFALMTTCAAGVLYFYRTNPPSSRTDDLFTRQMDQGLMIAREADAEEMVFTAGFTPEPQVQWYAKRTPFRIDYESEAFKLMRSAGIRKGVIFHETEHGLSADHLAQ